MPKPKLKEKSALADATRTALTRQAASLESSARAIDLAVLAPDAQSVSVGGEFNDWRVDSHPLQKNDRGHWQITLHLPPGVYQYKFVIDGTRWEDDADNPRRTVNEFGTSNSILEVV